MKHKHPDYCFYGYLEGLSSDNLAFVSQASTGVTIKLHKESYTADTFRQRATGRLVAAFKQDYSKVFCSKSCVSVTFNVKDSYFNDLLRSVKNLNPSIISRIMPTLDLFNHQQLQLPTLEGFQMYFNEEQLRAVQKIIAFPSAGPPILLTGAFGTGKSRLLALLVRYLQSCQSKQDLAPIRILVCTQQRVSADKFLEYYSEEFMESQCGNVYVIREYGYAQIDPKYEHHYKASKDFQGLQYKKFNNVLVITTCLTAPHLHFVLPGYFTHIIIDEGSQMREPEAIAPLFLATANTKIIMAGDENQVHSWYLKMPGACITGVSTTGESEPEVHKKALLVCMCLVIRKSKCSCNETCT